jgi:hypothetical protein
MMPNFRKNFSEAVDSSDFTGIECTKFNPLALHMRCAYLLPQLDLVAAS